MKTILEIRKKLLTVLMLILFGQSCFAFDLVEDGIYYNVVDGDLEVTYEYKDVPTSSYSGCIEIPETVEFEWKTFKVVRIGAEAFKGCDVVEVIIPGSIETICDKAFANSKIEKVIMPGIREIGNEAFAYSSIENIIIPESVRIIGDKAFAGSMLESVTIPANVTEFGQYIFSSTENLKYVKLPDSLEKLPWGMFYKSGIKEIELPVNMTEIQTNAFAYSKLERLTIPANVTRLGQYVIWECYNLTSLIFEDSEVPIVAVDAIGPKPRYNGYLYLGRDFDGCEGIYSEKKIFLEAFLPDCLSGFLETVEIGANCTVIPYRTFASDTAIKRINCYSKTPPTYPPYDWCRIHNVSEDCNYYYFTDEVCENAVLYVPEGSIESYKSHGIWGKFKNVVEGNITIGIDDVEQEDNKLKVRTNERTIIIEGCDEREQIAVYSLDGRIIYYGNKHCISIDIPGIYIVQAGGKASKILVK